MILSKITVKRKRQVERALFFSFRVSLIDIHFDLFFLLGHDNRRYYEEKKRRKKKEEEEGK
jgi:hypothetical protein